MTPPDPSGAAYLSLQDLATYSGLSVRTLRTFVRRSVDPLPCYKLPGKVLVKRSVFDTWIQRYASIGVEGHAIVEAIVKGVR
jgi:helix-turn-helix protein